MGTQKDPLKVEIPVTYCDYLFEFISGAYEEVLSAGNHKTEIVTKISLDSGKSLLK